ncbi:hypothetical protein I6N91_15125 [Arthrobacter sp. MSA 4-2]|uniref:hypothetical protein n=1 Tax=Arthrobacter sp. MSA 4-2 TaxID=2794349 RepID=UPI0018E7B1A5|nr:hypothetical protein [Arthrobacter sp. MSA 4-2]MBJ2122314.1 hypothetical protein [Arthrobacter sp. MSA 4-2]
MGDTGRRVSREKRRKHVHRIEDFPIHLRRAAAALVALLVALGSILFSVHTEAEFDRAGELVKTQEHWSGMLLYGSPRPGGRCDYYVMVEGKALLLNYSRFLPDDSWHAIVEYVVDPANEEHLIAVGSPEDWEDEPWNTAFGASVGGFSTLALIVVTWGRIVPEDGRTVWDKFFPSRKPAGRRARDLTPRNDRAGRHVR